MEDGKMGMKMEMLASCRCDEDTQLHDDAPPTVGLKGGAWGAAWAAWRGELTVLRLHPSAGTWALQPSRLAAPGSPVILHKQASNRQPPSKSHPRLISPPNKRLLL